MGEHPYPIETAFSTWLHPYAGPDVALRGATAPVVKAASPQSIRAEATEEEEDAAASIYEVSAEQPKKRDDRGGGRRHRQPPARTKTGPASRFRVHYTKESRAA